ncbi:MAG: class I SAM-dependent methyltransferase [Candidatus Hydrogenedentes bacterium]|nr:class I SAM-dependent methyltransferase [Candidatus Hydrogenedentota bacterium]
MSVVTRLAEACAAQRVLELGAGTGSNSRYFLEVHPCLFIGLDLSAKMLAQACAKPINAHWTQACATQLPLRSRSMDFVFGCYVLHHVQRLDDVFHECARVLDHGGVAFVTSPPDFIRRHPMNQYFPSFARVDGARFRSFEEIASNLKRAGFDDIGSERVYAEPVPIDQSYAEKVANKFISTYDLIPPEEFEQGLRRLRADLDTHGRLDTDMVWESLVVWGFR